jgi:hypothetical protein
MGNKSFTKAKKKENPGPFIVYKWAMMTCTRYETCGPTKHLTCKDYAIHWKPIMMQVLDETTTELPRFHLGNLSCKPHTT